MRNLVLFLWMMLGSFVFIECGHHRWYQPWYGKKFPEEWVKVTEPEKPSEDESSEESSEENESGDESTTESIIDFSSEQFAENPDIWPCLYKNCKGKEQSPINIDTQAISTDEELGPLKFENYDTPLNDLVIENAGYTIAVLVPTSANVTATSDWLGNKYRLFAVTFAYGHTNDNGSLHTIDSKYYQMEVTLAHLNEKYDKYENQPDALLYLDILFEIGKQNAAIKNITKSLSDIKEVDTNTTLKSSIKIKDLLPKFPENYVTYNGSTLIPPCTEGVKTVVFHYSNTISKKQLEKIRTVETVKNRRDFNAERRPVQPLNQRKILSSKSQEEKVWWYPQSSEEYWK